MTSKGLLAVAVAATHCYPLLPAHCTQRPLAHVSGKKVRDLAKDGQKNLSKSSRRHAREKKVGRRRTDFSHFLRSIFFLEKASVAFGYNWSENRAFELGFTNSFWIKLRNRSFEKKCRLNQCAPMGQISIFEYAQNSLQ